MAVAFVGAQSAAFRSAVLKRFPVNSRHGRFHSFSKGSELGSLILAPGRVARFRDPDLRRRSAFGKGALRVLDVFGPAAPRVLGDAGKPMNAYGVNIGHHAPVKHKFQPPAV